MQKQPHDPFRSDAARTEGLQAQVAASLGEPTSFSVVQQWKMPPAGWSGFAQGPSNAKLPGGAAQKVVATNHLGDAVAEIIDHHGELVRGPSVPGPDNGISTFAGGVEIDGSNKFIANRLWSFLHREAVACGGVVETPASPVARTQAGRKDQFASMRGPDRLSNFPATEIGSKDVATGRKAPHRFEVGVEIVGLESCRAVPVEAKPAKGLLESFARARCDSPGIQILVSKPHRPSLLTSDQPVQEKGPRISQMEIASGTRSESGDRGSAMGVGIAGLGDHGSFACSEDDADLWVIRSAAVGIVSRP